MSLKVYEIITNRIMEKLEEGTIPWKKPWGASGRPKNFVSKKPYKGINTFLTSSQGFTSEFWVTFKQAKTLKGSIKKGEKGTPVIFWKLLDKNKNGLDSKGKPNNDKIPLLRYYTVFNLEQTEGIEYETHEEKKTQNEIIEACQEVVEGMPLKPAMKKNCNRAYYVPSMDYVGMPKLESFKSSQGYHSVLFHELVHATGAEKRLNRAGVTNFDTFGSHQYSKEELVAEMGASFLNGHTGILEANIDNSSAYIASWLKALKNDKTMLIKAGAQAQKAVNYILKIKPEKFENSTERSA